jgi:Ca2+-binding RTX toxin-like protein
VDLEAPNLNTGDARGDRLSAIQGVIGTQYQDILQGTLAADALNGDAGSDLLQGRGGNDRLFGGAGIDTIEGGNHHDTLYAGSGNDWAYGGKGDDHIYGGDGDDSMVGLQNNDSIYSGDGADRLFGGDGNDMLFGGGGDDFLFGGLGADLFGHSGLTSAGTDMIYDYSATGGDSLYLTLAGAGPDQIGLTLEQRNIGGVTAPYVVVTHLPTGQVLWMLAATIPITDLDIKIGATVYDLL